MSRLGGGRVRLACVSVCVLCVHLSVQPARTPTHKTQDPHTNPPVNPQAAAADLHAVVHQVVRQRARRLDVPARLLDVLRVRRRERVVQRLEAPLLLIQPKHREISHPEQRVGGGGDHIKGAAEEEADAVQRAVDGGRGAGGD
jgi:hypothetical protein